MLEVAENVLLVEGTMLPSYLHTVTLFRCYYPIKHTKSDYLPKTQMFDIKVGWLTYIYQCCLSKMPATFLHICFKQGQTEFMLQTLHTFKFGHRNIT